jgi:3-hydroxyisobutyrate dehydrogenase-like beta-hydroxyacid dehydrogenase
MSRVGLVGVGLMGGAMALRLLDSGHAVAVCDIDATRVALAVAAGARAVATPAALASCEIIIVAVVDGKQTREVLFGPEGLANALPAGAAVMLCPTIGPADTESFAAALAEHGIGCIDAPMSGGPARARDGSMSLMVACPAALFERWQPLLQTLASRLFRVGERAGDGARTKLVNNLLAAINLAGAAEALALAGRLGLDPATTLGVIEASSGQSWIGSDRLRRALAGDTAPRAHVALLAKDSALALDAARGTGLALPVGEAAALRFAQALLAGLAQADDSALWRWTDAGAESSAEAALTRGRESGTAP